MTACLTAATGLGGSGAGGADASSAAPGATPPSSGTSRHERASRRILRDLRGEFGCTGSRRTRQGETGRSARLTPVLTAGLTGYSRRDSAEQIWGETPARFVTGGGVDLVGAGEGEDLANVVGADAAGGED